MRVALIFTPPNRLSPRQRIRPIPLILMGKKELSYFTFGLRLPNEQMPLRNDLNLGNPPLEKNLLYALEQRCRVAPDAFEATL